MSELEELLRERIGLDAASIGSSSIQRTLRLRMKSLGLRSLGDYRQQVQSSPAEWTELVEALVVSETWFFRDREAFGAMVRLVQQEWLPSRPTGQVRLLSLPCSSGEEPYSMAMALLEAGVPAERFSIEAIDLSVRALGRARQGLYGRNSFRGKDLAFRERWFQPAKEGYLLAPVVRRCVRFAQANLLSPEFCAGSVAYDFVFCRNLLIYFDRPTQGRALARLQSLLAPAGVLFVGAAELPLVLDHSFVSANLPLAFACRRADGPARALQHSRPTALRRTARRSGVPARNGATHLGLAPALAAPERRAAGQATTPGPSAAASGPSADPLPAGEAELEQARRLADAGQLQQAAALCETHLQKSRASAPGWYLLGLLREAGGDPTAIECYRKALYLQPDHYESLLQMASLAEKNGDTSRARTYKRRAERARPAATSEP